MQSCLMNRNQVRGGLSKLALLLSRCMMSLLHSLHPCDCMIELRLHVPIKWVSPSLCDCVSVNSACKLLQAVHRTSH